MNHLDVYDPLIVTFLLFLPVFNHPLPLELFVYLRLIIWILSLHTFAHLTVLSLSNPALNLTFSLLPITSSHPHAGAWDSTFDYWRYVNIWLTLIDIALCVCMCVCDEGEWWTVGGSKSCSLLSNQHPALTIHPPRHWHCRQTTVRLVSKSTRAVPYILFVFYPSPCGSGWGCAGVE